MARDETAVASFGMQTAPTLCPPPAPGSGTQTTARHLAEIILPNSALGVYKSTLFDNKEPATKHPTLPTVVCYDIGGPPPDLSNEVNIFEPRVSIRAIGLGDSDGYDAAQSKLQAIAQFLVKGITDVIDTTQYIGSYQESEVDFLHWDVNNLPIWFAEFRFSRLST